MPSASAVLRNVWPFISGNTARVADLAGKAAAVDRVMGVVEFTLDGHLLAANSNFLKVLGYSLDEIQGRHHRLFVDPAYAAGTEYRQFWDELGRGEFDAGEYKRIGKDGQEMWIQASYNPIIDASGKPCKVVKYATDITPQVQADQAMREMVKKMTEIAQAVDSAAREISAGNSNLSSRTESQAATVEEIASSMKELTGTVKQNADHVDRQTSLR